jgi:uncharacterized protein DUF4160
MPVVFRQDGIRYLFFSNEGEPREPPHVHVRGRTPRRGSRPKLTWSTATASTRESSGVFSAWCERSEPNC